MPMKYTGQVSVAMTPTTMGELGDRRSKLRQHRREAWILMNIRKGEFEKAKAELEQLMAEHEAWTRQFSALANQLKAKGLSFDQIRAITGQSQSAIERNVKEQVKLIA